MVVMMVLAGCDLPRLPAETAASLTEGTDPGSRIDAFVASLVEGRMFSGAVFAAKDGVILFDKGYGFADREKGLANTPQTKFRIGSITKQFTAMAVLILKSQGGLDVQDGICNYFADCPAAWRDITLHHLLTHTSGIPNYTDFPGFEQTLATPVTPGEIISGFRDRPLDFPPGAKWNYSNSGYILLGLVIEQVSGRSYEDFLRDFIFSPLGMARTGYDHNRSDLAIGYDDAFAKAAYTDMSVPFSAGALFSTTEDLFLWDQALSTETLIPRGLLEIMFRPYISMRELIPHVPTPASRGMFYGYGWMIGESSGRRWVYHDGGMNGFVSHNGLYPDDMAVIVILSNQRNSSGVMDSIIQEIEGAIFMGG